MLLRRRSFNLAVLRSFCKKGGWELRSLRFKSEGHLREFSLFSPVLLAAVAVAVVLEVLWRITDQRPIAGRFRCFPGAVIHTYRPNRTRHSEPRWHPNKTINPQQTRAVAGDYTRCNCAVGMGFAAIMRILCWYCFWPAAYTFFFAHAESLFSFGRRFTPTPTLLAFGRNLQNRER